MMMLLLKILPVLGLVSLVIIFLCRRYFCSISVGFGDSFTVSQYFCGRSVKVDVCF